MNEEYPKYALVKWGSLTQKRKILSKSPGGRYECVICEASHIPFGSPEMINWIDEIDIVEWL